MLQNDRTPLLMIGIDAAEISLMSRWMEDGSLPNLRRVRDRGAFLPLKSTADWLVGSPWPSFYTGTPPGEHGLYHYLMWRPGLMRHDRPTPEWMPLPTFWRDLADRGLRVAAVDVPLAYAPEPYPGRELCGWATHETLQPTCSQPPELIADIERRIGRPPFDDEEAYLLTASQLLQVRDQCVRTTEMVAQAGAMLVEEEPCDLFLLCFSATHRAGHQLWDRANMLGEATAAEQDALNDALRQVYVAADAGIGRLIDAMDGEPNILLFSLHGMGVNNSRVDVLAEMLSRVLAGDAPDVKPGLLDKLRALVPADVRSWVKTRLPLFLQDKLTLFWRTRGIDWSTTSAFAAFSDLYGYIRINLQGREADGIVAPEEYDALRDRIIAGLATFVDEDSGEAAVEATMKIEQLYPDGAMQSHLPDLLIRWTPTAAAKHRALVSPQFGRVAWPTPGTHPQGRSGNHRGEGFLIAAGPDIGSEPPEAAHILDLAPTAYALLGLDPPATKHGKPLFKQKALC
ncbi:MAG: alkaline phosphatase family protein [Sphingobium sp.]